MIPYDIDPSLHDSKPEPQELGDGFSPPASESTPHAPAQPLEHAIERLGDKSPF